MSTLTKESFLKDVDNHEMQILLDTGVFRHIVFRAPESSSFSFRITTFPGGLCYTGDVGSFVFERLDDMFEFFRNDAGTINPHYWAEKLVAADTWKGYEEFCPERLKRYVLDELETRAEEEAWDEGKKYRILRDARRQILRCDNDYEAHDALHQFESEGFKFSDTFEWDLKEYTDRFIWCCYALVWGISMYDESHENKA